MSKRKYLYKNCQLFKTVRGKNTSEMFLSHHHYVIANIKYIQRYSASLKAHIHTQKGQHLSPEPTVHHGTCRVVWLPPHWPNLITDMDCMSSLTNRQDTTLHTKRLSECSGTERKKKNFLKRGQWPRLMDVGCQNVCR